MLRKLYKRIQVLYKRRQNAKKLGIKFFRAGLWDLPHQIIINNKPVKLNLVNDTSTSNAFLDILLNDCYGLNVFKHHLRVVDTIIDIGANQGLFLLHGRNIFPAANLYAYEPNQSIFQNLSYHSGLINANYFNEAVGLTSGKVILKSGHDSLHGKTTLNETGNISQISISECLLRIPGRPDLLKLDCEGAEWEIFKDFDSLKKVKAITLEYHLDDEHFTYHLNDHNTIIKILLNNHFKVLKHSIDASTWGVVWAINQEMS